jgi:hypothetical protein
MIIPRQVGGAIGSGRGLGAVIDPPEGIVESLGSIVRIHKSFFNVLREPRTSVVLRRQKSAGRFSPYSPY